jgi:hypothetical protein
MKDLASKVNFFVSYVILSKLKAEKEGILSTSLEKLFFPLKTELNVKTMETIVLLGLLTSLGTKV